MTFYQNPIISRALSRKKESHHLPEIQPQRAPLECPPTTNTAPAILKTKAKTSEMPSHVTLSRNKRLSRTTENDLLEIKESPGIPSYEVYS